jgi:hypothetical protein
MASPAASDPWPSVTLVREPYGGEGRFHGDGRAQGAPRAPPSGDQVQIGVLLAAVARLQAASQLHPAISPLLVKAEVIPGSSASRS